MTKRILLFISCFCCLGTFAQNLPTLVSYQVDTLCYGESGEVVLFNVQVEDLDMDSTFIIISGFDSNILNNLTVISPAYVPTATIRTFQIKADAGGLLSAGVNLTDIDVTLNGNVPLDGGGTFTTITDLAVYGDLGAFFSLSTVQICNNSNPVDISSYGTPAGGTFSWVSQTSNYFDPQIYQSEGGTFVQYTYINAAGCMDYYTAGGPILLSTPTLFVSPSYSTCGNADGYIMSSISGGTAPYDIYWSTGFEETGISGAPQDVTNLGPGNYYGNVTDANGCKGVTLAQISDIEVDLGYDPTDETCMYQSQDGSIDLTITPSMGTVNYIYWSNGQTTEDLLNVSKGEYLVEVRTDAGCEANGAYFVSAAPLPYAQNSNSTDASCSGSDGIVDYDIYNGSGSYTYLWNTGATTQDLFGVPSGTYTCVVTDAVFGCSFEYFHCVYSGGGPGANFVYDVKPTCGASDGMINVNTYPFSAPITSIVWSSGHTTEDLVNVPAGDYEITVTAQDGCVFKQTFFLESKAPERPGICLLTVDTSLIYNMVVWEKDLSQPAIDGFRIYRETSTYGNFELVADRDYSLESFFQDNDASPVDRSWRYYMTAYDACGNESDPSEVHKTIHVVSTTTDNINYDIYWDDYEGLNYTSVDVFRFDSTNGWANIDNVLAGTHTTSDTPPVTTGLDYLIQFNLADPCTSTKAQDHNSSRSNRTASAFAPGGTTAGLINADPGFITVYPNPTNGDFVLHVDQPELFNAYEITSMNGEVISTGMIYTNKTTISTESMAAGVYLVRLVSEEGIVVKKLMKN